ncbi:GNAT family N-acetyltransferase [Alistipes indistinctus]|jgi:acetyltransferase, GNAT family|uniref:GNAT family N-acetyltransferase n=1 Tax=Alistipes indistinctus TaxID=626932 RepID=UPI002676FA30|nr:GNAT family N-acetyltransferase [Alistipes indistinctus]
MIRPVTLRDDFVPLAELLNRAFAPVAEAFGLTRENSPNHNAFITGSELKAQLTGNREFYLWTEQEQEQEQEQAHAQEEANEKEEKKRARIQGSRQELPVGFIAIERSASAPGTFYIEKVAVRPRYRHAGVGRRMMEFATERIAALGGKRISIGLIDSHNVLKSWYADQGYVQTAVRNFAHLPFEVCLMEKKLIDRAKKS